MNLNAALDIAIGLILMYLVLSLVCTSLNEFISTTLGMRANTLKQGLTHIIDSETLRSEFDKHGLVVAATPGGKSAPSYLSGSAFALALLDSLDPKTPLPKIDIKAAAERLTGTNVGDLLATSLATAGDDLERLKETLAASFDQMMDRLSGIYRRRLKLISLLVGLALAAVLNADSLAVAKALWNDGSLRTQMAQSAQSFVQAGMPTGQTANSIDKIANDIKTAEEKLRPLPIGWTFDSREPLGPFWLFKAVGLAITAVALSLGAPFWFDLLSKFMNIRGTGNKPQRTDPPADKK
jgi:hypothetical protein